MGLVHYQRGLMSENILRLPAVKARTGLSRSSLYLKITKGQFPRPIALGERSVGWVESDIDAWINGRIERSKKTEAA